MRAREIKRKWVAALESGEYKQAEGVLYDPFTKGFCCLGVLQHCLLDGKVETYNDADGENSPEAFTSFEEEKCASLYAPSDDFYRAFPQLGWVKVNQGSLMVMNDEDRVTFKEIAACIRKEWKVS